MQKKLTKIFVFTSLLIDEIDDPIKRPTKTTKEIQDKARELQDLLLPVLDKFYDSKDVRKTNLFTELQRKVNYNFDKIFK